MALRLTSHLMLGIVRIYHWKARYFQYDVVRAVSAAASESAAPAPGSAAAAGAAAGGLLGGTEAAGGALAREADVTLAPAPRVPPALFAVDDESPGALLASWSRRGARAEGLLGDVDVLDLAPDGLLPGELGAASGLRSPRSPASSASVESVASDAEHDDSEFLRFPSGLATPSVSGLGSELGGVNLDEVASAAPEVLRRAASSAAYAATLTPTSAGGWSELSQGSGKGLGSGGPASLLPPGSGSMPGSGAGGQDRGSLSGTPGQSPLDATAGRALLESTFDDIHLGEEWLQTFDEEEQERQRAAGGLDAAELVASPENGVEAPAEGSLAGMPHRVAVAELTADVTPGEGAAASTGSVPASSLDGAPASRPARRAARPPSARPHFRAKEDAITVLEDGAEDGARAAWPERREMLGLVRRAVRRAAGEEWSQEDGTGAATGEEGAATGAAWSSRPAASSHLLISASTTGPLGDLLERARDRADAAARRALERRRRERAASTSAPGAARATALASTTPVGSVPASTPEQLRLAGGTAALPARDAFASELGGDGWGGASRPGSTQQLQAPGLSSTLGPSPGSLPASSANPTPLSGLGSHTPLSGFLGPSPDQLAFETPSQGTPAGASWMARRFTAAANVVFALVERLAKRDRAGRRQPVAYRTLVARVYETVNPGPGMLYRTGAEELSEVMRLKTAGAVSLRNDGFGGALEVASRRGEPGFHEPPPEVVGEALLASEGASAPRSRRASVTGTSSAGQLSSPRSRRESIGSRSSGLVLGRA